MSLPEGTVTFLRSDIEGSMDLVRALGARYDELNALHGALVQAAVAEHGGLVIRTEGDAFFVVFTDAAAAARCAVEVQRAMAAHAWPDGHPLRVRVGIHTGAATRAGDDYGGFEVNRAARIAAAGWGGQIIISDATRALVSVDSGTGLKVRDLGHHRLKGVPQPQRLFQLDAPGLSTSFPPLLSGYGPAEHLPEHRGSFIGREGELESLDALLAGTRLLTLTGPGGTGKTTLAVELARRQAAQFADGAWFVDLQAVRDADLVLPEMAASLSLFDGPAGPAADRLMGFVGEREMLIVVDNFEQVLEATRVLVDLIAASPRTKVVVTSRIPLRISAGQDYPVQPLGVRPAVDGSEGEAVRLFIERARRVRPDLSFDDPELDIVRETCTLVDGLPLAVELCASRAAALPVPMIRDRLAARAPLPGSGPRDLPDRQRTIEETVAWSYDLLDAPLKALFGRLAVFRESFDYEQTEEVCGAADDVGVDVLDGLVRLVDHSLLTRIDDAVGGVRFRMLETIRVFAWDRLAESGRASEYEERHARAYVGLAIQAAPHLEELDIRLWRDRLDVDDANLRAALDWAVSAADLRLVHVGVGNLWRYWQLTGRLTEGLDRTTTALKMPGADEPTPERIRVIAADGNIAYWQGDLARAKGRYEDQLALAQQLDAASEVADAWLSLLFVSDYGGDMELGERAEASARRQYAELGDQQGMDRVTLASVSSIAPAALSDPQRWMPELESRLARAEAIEGERAAMACIAVRSALRLMRGDESGAVEAAAKVIRMASELGRDGEAVMMLPPIIQFAVTTRQHEVAVVALGAFTATRARFGALTETPFEAYGGSDPTETLRSAMGDQSFDMAFERGARMPLADVTDLLESELQTA